MAAGLYAPWGVEMENCMNRPIELGGNCTVDRNVESRNVTSTQNVIRLRFGLTQNVTIMGNINPFFVKPRNVTSTRNVT